MYWIILWILLVLGLGFCLWFLWKNVPRYAVLPVLLTVAVNGLAYYVPKLIPTGIQPVYMGLPIDESIPFCQEFIFMCWHTFSGPWAGCCWPVRSGLL